MAAEESAAPEFLRQEPPLEILVVPQLQRLHRSYRQRAHFDV